MSVFISYSSKSRNYRILLENYLKDHGVTSFWIDEEEIRPGENISDRIKAGVGQCSCCVFLLNQHSLDSTWCMAEVGAFWGANKRIIVHPIDPRCNVPPILEGILLAKNLEDVIKSCSEVPPVRMMDAAFLESFWRSKLNDAFRIPTEDSRREKRIEELVRAECEKSGEKRFRLVASSGFNYLHPSGKVWRVGLGTAIETLNIPFQVVLESPFSQFALTRALANRVTHSHWEEKVIVPVLEKLDSYNNVEIRITDHPINCSLFFTSDAVFYDPYLWALPNISGRTENNFWVLEFGQAESAVYDCYALLEGHFSFLATKSQPLGEFLGEGRQRYKKLSRQFSDRIKNYHESEDR